MSKNEETTETPTQQPNQDPTPVIVPKPPESIERPKPREVFEHDETTYNTKVIISENLND
jgi:hypothetical protein